MLNYFPLQSNRYVSPLAGFTSIHSHKETRNSKRLLSPTTTSCTPLSLSKLCTTLLHSNKVRHRCIRHQDKKGFFFSSFANENNEAGWYQKPCMVRAVRTRNPRKVVLIIACCDSDALSAPSLANENLSDAALAVTSTATAAHYRDRTIESRHNRCAGLVCVCIAVEYAYIVRVLLVCLLLMLPNPIQRDLLESAQQSRGDYYFFNEAKPTSTIG